MGTGRSWFDPSVGNLDPNVTQGIVSNAWKGGYFAPGGAGPSQGAEVSAPWYDSNAKLGYTPGGGGYKYGGGDASTGEMNPWEQTGGSFMQRRSDGNFNSFDQTGRYLRSANDSNTMDAKDYATYAALIAGAYYGLGDPSALGGEAATGDAATSAAWQSGAGLGGDTVTAVGGGTTAGGTAAGTSTVATAAEAATYSHEGATAGQLAGVNSANATAPASMTSLTGAELLDKVISNPKVWQAGLGAVGSAMNSGGSVPTIPNQQSAALATANSGKYNEVGPLGNVSWTLRPGADPNNPQPGDYIRTTELAPGQQQLLDASNTNKLGAAGLAGGQISDMQGGRQAVADALYKQTTQYYDQRFNRDEDALRTRLMNEGLHQGSEAWDNAMTEFQQNKNTAYADATQKAITGADAQQNNTVARLSNILAMSGMQSPTSANSSGGNPVDLLTAANNQYNSELASSNASKAQNTQNMNSIIALIAALNGGG